MSGRPDYADLGGEPARMRAGRHERCVCGDENPCTCGRLRAPSPGFRFRRLRLLTWNDFLLVIEVAVEAFRGVITPKLDLILKELKKMGIREDAADARTAELIELVRQHNADKDAKIAELQAALASADADKAAALDAASEEDAGRQEAFNSALDELAGNAAPPAEPAPAEEPPAQPEPTSADGA